MTQKPMTQKMINRRTEIIVHITKGLSDREIARRTSYSRDLVSEVRKQLNEGAIKTTYDGTGRPRKDTNEIRDMIV